MENYIIQRALGDPWPVDWRLGQNPIPEQCITAWTDTSPATPADSATLPSNHSAARSARSFCSPGGSPPYHTTSPSRTLEPGVSGPWNEMRPQKMNTSGALCTFSSVHRPPSKPSGADLLEKNLVDIQNLRQRLGKSVSINDRLQERLERVLSSSDQGKGIAQSASDFLVTPHSYTQSHCPGSDQEFL
ncbi:PREDICTED: myomegalin-like [Chrysochloris asiatica]|uniref:Myomegalin-like n=1 Tax=Chrysochloris asiatica TaxID=185453 RepID=A0A9B0TB35_CHRAS|nr:PREDICTED: myomegalin-like [Chrysochloris asiatica]